MTQLPNRRRFLQLTGVSAAASVAGCTQLRATDGDDPEADDTVTDDGGDDEVEVDNEPDIDAEDGITALVQPDQEDLEQMRAVLMDEAEDGELDQHEIQQEFMERRTALIEEAADEFEAVASDTDGLTIEGSILEQGLFLVDAPDETLMDALRAGDLNGLFSGEEFDRVQEQQPAP